MNMGGGAWASSEANHSEMKPSAKNTAVDSREGCVSEDSTSVFTREEAKSLDGTEIGDLVSLAAIRTCSATGNTIRSGCTARNTGIRVIRGGSQVATRRGEEAL